MKEADVMFSRKPPIRLPKIPLTVNIAVSMD